MNILTGLVGIHVWALRLSTFVAWVPVPAIYLNTATVLVQFDYLSIYEYSPSQ